MPVTRSSERNTNSDAQANVSFVLEGNDTTSPGVVHRNRSNMRCLDADRRRTLSASIERRIRLYEHNIRVMISESISEIRGEITSTITNEVARLVESINVSDNATEPRGISTEENTSGWDRHENLTTLQNNPKRLYILFVIGS